ncbi:histone-lysine N-methyltransferase, H3 lysine-79 specific-like [Fagus crenata]
MEVEVDWDKDKMQKKNFPSLPSNYVTLIQLKERKQRKLKEKEEQERQRMLQLRKIQEEEEERKRELQRQQEEEERKRELQRQQEEEGRKRKLERQGLKQERNKTDRKPARHNSDHKLARHNSDHKPASHNGRKNWQRNDRAVEVWRAKPEESMAVVAVVVDIRKVSAQQEQSSDEAKEKNKNTRQKRKKKMKPRAEEEEVKEKGTTDGESHALHVISEKENSPARRNGEPEGTRTEEVDRTAEIERKFGDFSIGKGNVRATRPNTGIYHGNRQHRPYGGVHREYNGSGSIGGSRAVRNPSGSGMVWVRKGEIGGVRNQSSIVEPKKLE